MNTIANRITSIQDKILSYKKKHNKNQSNIALLAVSKTKPFSDILSAYQAGQRRFGENYVQEAVDKIEHLSAYPDIEWHFIGPIQSNKTRLIAENFSWVHSIDREKTALRLNTQRPKQLDKLHVLIQVNISGESSKSGVLVAEVEALANTINDCDQLELRGLMAVPSPSYNNLELDKEFIIMQSLYNQLKSKFSTIDTLSMGMSNDLELAIKHDANMVRIGTAIFGTRDK